MKDHACETYQTMQHPQRPYGLLGKTLKHSFSPQLHAAIGAALGTPYPYILFEKQPEESPTPYAAMITKQMGLMDFRKSAEELERLVRGLNPWPSAYTFLNGKTLKVWKCKVSTEKTDAVPGTIFLADKEGIHTACGEGVLILTEVQLEGKKRMETEAFLRGYHIENGIVFTDHKE